MKKPRDVHPTKALLLRTGVDLAAEHGLYGYTVEMLLDESGISKGSLYHHFEDFGNFVESVQVEIFTRYVDEDVANIAVAFERAESPAAFRRFITAVVSSPFLPGRPESRLLRASMTGATNGRDDYRRRLGDAQLRIRSQLSDLIEQAKLRGWVRPEVHADTAAAFMLAYSFGIVIDEVTGHPVDQAAWRDMVMAFMDRVILAEV